MFALEIKTPINKNINSTSYLKNPTMKDLSLHISPKKTQRKQLAI